MYFQSYYKMAKLHWSVDLTKFGIMAWFLNSTDVVYMDSYSIGLLTTLLKNAEGSYKWTVI